MCLLSDSSFFTKANHGVPTSIKYSFVLFLFLVWIKVARIRFHLQIHIDVVLESGLIRTPPESITKVIIVTKPIAPTDSGNHTNIRTFSQTAYSNTSPKRRMGRCGTSKWSSARPAAAFEEATETLCNGNCQPNSTTFFANCKLLTNCRKSTLEGCLETSPLTKQLSHKVLQENTKFL